MGGFEGLLMTVLRISVGFSVIYGIRVMANYYFGDVKEGGKTNGSHFKHTNNR